MRIGSFEVNVPAGAHLPAAAGDVRACLQYLEANPLEGREPVRIARPSGRLGMNVPPKDLKKILSVIENRAKYSGWDRFCKFFNCGIGARAEKYLGEVLGGDIREILHKLDDGRFDQ